MNFKHWLLLTEAKKSSDIAKELLDNNDALINQIKSIIPTDAKQDLQAKLLPIAAYYYKQQPNINTLKQDIQDYADLVKLNKMQIITVNDDLTINNDFKSYIHWTEIIDGKKHEGKVLNAPIQGDLEDQELIAHSPDNKIKVYKANSVNQVNLSVYHNQLILCSNLTEILKFQPSTLFMIIQELMILQSL